MDSRSQFSEFGSLEKHGFARNRMWSIDTNPPPSTTNSPSRAAIDLILKPSKEDLKIFPHSTLSNPPICYKTRTTTESRHRTLNDWYDREIDAINEPYRPIPSGVISENEVITHIWVLLLGGLGLAGILDVWLKQNGWIGNFALGASYISLPWELQRHKKVKARDALRTELLSLVKKFIGKVGKD
ncbi:hypothetical protein ACET3Z_014319 [Daucus carota]